MKVKELKAILDGRDDDFEVVVSDVTDRSVQVVGGGETSSDKLVHLFVRQEFPESWFKDGEEIRWLYGKAVVPSLLEEKEEILLHNEEVFGTSDEVYVKLTFYDGYAIGDGVRMTYPKLSELKDYQIEEIDGYLGGRISDSGVIVPYDVCIALGKIELYGIINQCNSHNRDLVRQINEKWIRFKDSFKPVLLALYDRDLYEIMYSDAFTWPEAADSDYVFSDLQTRWDEHAENYLMHIADDQDLKTILTFVRYDKVEK